MKRTDEIFTFDERQPKKDFYWIFENSNGTSEYHRTTMAEYNRFDALYSVPKTGYWSYTCHEADKVS